MTDFNDLFPRSEGSFSLEPRKTSWPMAEEYLRPVLDTFQELAGFEPKGFLRKQWVAGARDWVSVFGEDTELLRLATEEMRERNLTVITPRSCISVASELKHQMKRDYTGGKYGGFVER